MVSPAIPSIQLGNGREPMKKIVDVVILQSENPKRCSATGITHRVKHHPPCETATSDLTRTTYRPTIGACPSTQILHMEQASCSRNHRAVHAKFIEMNTFYSWFFGLKMARAAFRNFCLTASEGAKDGSRSRECLPL